MTTPSREEVDAIWEKLRALEERMEGLGEQVSADVLRIAKELATASAFSFHNYMRHLATGMGKHKAYSSYMSPKFKSLVVHIRDAQSIADVFNLHMTFIEDCVAYIESLTP